MIPGYTRYTRYHLKKEIKKKNHLNKTLKNKINKDHLG